MPNDVTPIEIIAKAVERAVNPATGGESVRVRLTHTTPEGIDLEWSIWIPEESSFDRAVELAREALNRTSALIAANSDTRSHIGQETAQPDRSPGKERERKWRANQEKTRSHWAK